MTINNCMLNMKYTQASSAKKKKKKFVVLNLAIRVVKEETGADQEAENQRLRFFNFDKMCFMTNSWLSLAGKVHSLILKSPCFN